MFSKIIAKFKSKPSFYYSMSIAATWAGVGSLMMGVEMAQKYGVLPFLLWALGNTLACILFGIFAPKRYCDDPSLPFAGSSTPKFS